MKQKLFYFFSLIVTIFITSTICFFISMQHETKMVNKAISDMKAAAYKVGQSKTEFDCSYENIIYTYESLFNDGNGRGAYLYSNIKKKNSNKELKMFINNVEKNFSKQSKFLDLFAFNKKELDKLSKMNITRLYKSDKESFFSPLSKSWENLSEEYFNNAQLIYLESLLNAYCEQAQDTEGCAKMVFEKINE